jgi:2,3-bisphosphoglycerate-dependent phosphoglycerate mutase
VVLVRHALSIPPTADGPDELTRPLAGGGLQQAVDLVEILTELSPVAVWSSPYRRAIQTVEPTAEALGLLVRSSWELREWDDGLPYTEGWEPHYARSWADPSYARPEGESLNQLTVRAVAAVRALAHDNRGRLVIAANHGTFIYRLRFADPSALPEVTGDCL